MVNHVLWIKGCFVSSRKKETGTEEGDVGCYCPSLPFDLFWLNNNNNNNKYDNNNNNILKKKLR
jgi:hypothetical protein